MGVRPCLVQQENETEHCVNQAPNVVLVALGFSINFGVLQYHFYAKKKQEQATCSPVFFILSTIQGPKVALLISQKPDLIQGNEWHFWIQRTIKPINQLKNLRPLKKKFKCRPVLYRQL